ncbi:hypothetical protein BUALT_Bualt15G0013100 [Buddleja alternifolia]|uniref:Dirigent protein n=1 Tax=Buddleja alternifolia TaxID=168488 RepID=A0AAV6WMC3_9LAMI|nr:hypothetical protein BUALT_Bualt15G0013100 [Buddleja alternifolia]
MTIVSAVVRGPSQYDGLNAYISWVIRKGLLLISLWAEILLQVIAKEKVTKLRFFVQDRISGQNQTVYRVTQSDITSTSPTLFGQVNMVDDPITVSPGAQSKILGKLKADIRRHQSRPERHNARVSVWLGIAAGATGFEAQGLSPTFNTVIGVNQIVYKVAQSNITSSFPTLFWQVDVVDDPFTVGPKPNPRFWAELKKYRQMPVGSGTGAFAMTKGIVTTSTYSFDTATNNAVLEYKIVDNHY